MYQDYDVVFKSDAHELLMYLTIFGIAALIAAVIIFISLSKILKKAGRSSILGLIPIYNIIPLLEITNMSKVYFFILIIPIVNIPFFLIVNKKLAELFKKNNNFGIGLLVLPFIFYPILAFSDSEYIGINLSAMDDKNSVNDIPIIDDDKNNPIEKEINDEIVETSVSSSISLGGGKYQNDYKNSLLTVEEDIKAKGENKKLKETEIKDGKFLTKELLEKSEKENKINLLMKTNNSDSLFNVGYIGAEAITSDNQQLQNRNMGQSLQNTMTTQSNIRLCPNCGTRLADDVKICIICGQKLR